MYGLAGRGGFYVAVAMDDLRFLRVTHSARCMTETYKKKKTKQRAALRAVKKLFTATYIIWYERDRKCRAFTESSRISFFSPAKREVVRDEVKCGHKSRTRKKFHILQIFFFLAYVNLIRNAAMVNRNSRIENRETDT